MGKRRYFTLLELLIVISIIIILISILMPSLRTAKGKANEILCLSNLKQSGLSVLQYADDNGGWSPCSYRPWSSRQWGSWLISLDYLPGNDSNGLLGKSSIIVCPSAPPYGKYNHLNNTYGFRRQGGEQTFYQLYRGNITCMFYTSPSTYTPYAYPSTNWHPSKAVIIADTKDYAIENKKQYYSFQTTVTGSSTTRRMHTRHSNAANVWFPDGHSGRLTDSYLAENGFKFFDLNGIEH
ncbi:MAG: hypothetical protein A2017_17850 [Lentisphaerae bacterium GWF2_44_16]|nr:MAG: hypothetical protein A2017_17850 [Lentisphaerae bacterium GWF2_44_16]